ncbi:MAG: DUF2085 domain-containing protein [Acidobacteriota bacterium]|nr:MAG: DUF2085 domain-containing protein [Acidobacteriota bacterium]
MTITDNHNPSRPIYYGLIALTAAWLLGLAAAPWLMAGGYPLPAVILYRGFSVICHQLPDRSFEYQSLPFGVCARCTGIYVGFLAGLLVYPLWRSLRETEPPPARWLVAAALPMLVDYAGDLIGLFANNHLSRTLTGAIAGMVGAWFLLPTLVALFPAQEGSSGKLHHYIIEGETE